MYKLNVNPKLKKQIITFDKKNIWNYLFILDYLYRETVRVKENTIYTFFPINSTFMWSIFGRNYKQLLTNLLKLNIIESDYSYLAGAYSTGYRLAIEFNKNDWEYVKMPNKKLLERLKKYNDMKNKKADKTTPTETSPGYSTVIDTLLNKYTVKKDEALSFIKTLDLTDDQRIIYERRILAIANHDLFYSIDSYGHRLHTNETNLPRVLRQFVLIDGKPCEELDIANSQPLFFAKLLISKKADVNPNELQKYTSICEQGKFYEFFAEKLGVTFNSEEDRAEFKVNIFAKVLYCKLSNRLNEYQKAFKKEFPTIFKYLQNMKKDDYHNVSIELQRMESETIFKIIEKYSEIHPNASLLTIHDSVVVAFDELKLLCRVVMEEMKAEGINPTIKNK